MKTSKTIPAVVLVLLLLAWFVRWDYVASKTYSNGTVMFKVDRWTGYKWVDFYGVDPSGNLKSSEQPAYDNSKKLNAASKARKIATRVWYGLVAADCIWMIILLVAPAIKRRKEPNDCSQPIKEM